MQSSKAPKKTRKIAEKPVVKHHHKLTNQVVSEPVSETPSSTAKTFAAAAGASSTMTTSLPDAPTRVLRQHDIAELAYSYWVDRNYAPGSPEEDWLRAERELAGR